VSADRPPGPILSIDGLCMAYHARGTAIRALAGATLEIGAGESVGLVGESGSGKSTLARAALGLLPENIARIEAGRMTLCGRDVTRLSDEQWQTQRGSPVAMVFQDPLSFMNPVMRVGRQIAESVERHTPELAPKKRVMELLELVKLPAGCAQSYPHELSGGMRQRALLAVALGCKPKLLIADEPTTALDVTTQAEVLALLRELRGRLGMAMLLISHDLGIVAQNCERIYVMYAGRTIEWGSAQQVFRESKHPYTQGLLEAALAARDAEGRFHTIGGDPPNLADAIAGCPFAPRCARVQPECRSAMPEPVLTNTQPPHAVRCVLYR
jgi:oligopeptide/dipeptide ABC transporter ATP-binding protein